MTELKQQIRENGIWYTLVGDYYIPNLTLPEEERSIGRYGRLHREYLRETKPHTYNDLILTGRLWTCLADLDEQAEERLNHIIRRCYRGTENTGSDGVGLPYEQHPGTRGRDHPA